MMWSKLKTLVEARFVSGLQGRVQVFQTIYRKSNDEEGEFWVTLDKEKAFSCATMTFFKEYDNEMTRGMASDAELPAREPEIRVRQNLMMRGIMRLEDANSLLRDSLNMPIEGMETHICPLIRGMAVIDSRFGKRRLEKFDVSQEHEFVRLMHSTRRAI